MKTVYLDGHYLKVNPQIIEVFTPGSLQASGVFETMLGVDGAVIDLALHLKRMRQGLNVLKISPFKLDQSIFKKLMVANQLSMARVRLLVWKAGRHTHILVVALPYKISNKKKFRVCLIKTDRSANDRLANVKSLDYELFAKAYVKARNQGLDEALLINRRGYIFEASRANIFWIKNKILFTPPLSSGCLNGITRQQVIRQARALKISVKEINLTAKILKESDAAFLTNSLIGIKPIHMILD